MDSTHRFWIGLDFGQILEDLSDFGRFLLFSIKFKMSKKGDYENHSHERVIRIVEKVRISPGQSGFKVPRWARDGDKIKNRLVNYERILRFN